MSQIHRIFIPSFNIFLVYAFCNDMGLSMTAAFTIFAKTVTREKRIPFEVSADPFYSETCNA